MIKVFVNNNLVLVPANTSVLEACELSGEVIPRFCYHERLNVSGNCRMCLVEIEKAPKPIASCAFPVAPNMRIYTDTPLVQKARENVLEFLLINHPLDCPICDQGGECDLQEQTMAFGSDRSRFSTSKRSVEDKNCGPLIKTIMTRCIHCTRCIRFLQDIAGHEDFGTTLRGQDTEIGTYIGKTLSSELSGNIIDLCPVGALTSKPYAFTSRPWEIKSLETIDLTDAVGSNIKVNFKDSEILRILPLLNDSLNEEWLSDKGRFFFDSLKISRLGHPYIRKNLSFSKTSWKSSLDLIITKFRTTMPDKNYFVCGGNLDIETLELFKTLSKLSGVSIISDNFSEANVDLLSSAKHNTTFSDILISDVCLTVGTVIRFEASMLNLRIKKRSRVGSFLKASIGLIENSTYNEKFLGSSLVSFLEISEGKNEFCRFLVKSKKPLLTFGSSNKRRYDFFSLTTLISEISKYTKIISKDWFGINFVPLSSNSIGKVFVGLRTNSKVRLDDIKFFYCIGLDSYASIFSKISAEDSFAISQTPFVTTNLKQANLLLPSTAFTETRGLFLNMEGRPQKTARILPGPSLARDDAKIINAIFSENLKHHTFSLPKKMYNFLENKSIFTKELFLTRPKGLFKILRTPLKMSFSNFFTSNILSKNSLLLAESASNLRKNSKNFF